MTRYLRYSDLLTRTLSDTAAHAKTLWPHWVRDLHVGAGSHGPHDILVLCTMDRRHHRAGGDTDLRQLLRNDPSTTVTICHRCEPDIMTTPTPAEVASSAAIGAVTRHDRANRVPVDVWNLYQYRRWIPTVDNLAERHHHQLIATAATSRYETVLASDGPAWQASARTSAAWQLDRRSPSTMPRTERDAYLADIAGTYDELGDHLVFADLRCPISPIPDPPFTSLDATTLVPWPDLPGGFALLAPYAPWPIDDYGDVVAAVVPGIVAAALEAARQDRYVAAGPVTETAAAFQDASQHDRVFLAAQLAFSGRRDNTLHVADTLLD